MAIGNMYMPIANSRDVKITTKKSNGEGGVIQRFERLSDILIIIIFIVQFSRDVIVFKIFDLF